MEGQQLNMQFPEVPKSPMVDHMESMAEAQKKYGVTKPLVLGENNLWYVEDYGGKMIEVSEWAAQYDKLSERGEHDRRDIN